MSLKFAIINIIKKVYALIDKLSSNRIFITILFLGNLSGAIIGFYYYSMWFPEFFTSLNFFLWIFVADCPMSAFLFLGFLIQKKEKTYANYNNFVFIQMIRSMVFTYLIILFYGSLDFEIVVIGHFLLFIEALLILPYIRINKNYIYVVFLVLINDVLDFFGGTLAQLDTIQPLFTFYMTSIICLDVILIISVMLIANFNKLYLITISECDV